MKSNINSEEKNLLDLRHSLYLTKASLFPRKSSLCSDFLDPKFRNCDEFCGFSIGVGGVIAIFFGLWQLIKDVTFKGVPLPFLIADVWFVIFAWISILHFNRCNEIQTKIEKSLKNKA